MNTKIDILFENDDIVVVNKPEGIPTHAPNDTKLGVVEILSEQLGTKLGVHSRLDEGTSGVLAFSKSHAGADLLTKSFELRDVRKYYYAIVCGKPPQERGEWQHKLITKNGITIDGKDDPSAKTARCRYRVVSVFAPFCLLELQLLTGMTHQLRVQCALEGMPILGDAVYGGGAFAPRLCLHASKLVLSANKNLPHFSAPLPNLMTHPSTAKTIAAILHSISQKYLSLPETEAIRLASPQHSGIPELLLEKIADTFVIRHLEPTDATLWTESALDTLIHIAQREFKCSNFAYLVHESPNKSKLCKRFAKSFHTENAPFSATELGNSYKFDLSGNATGLYLDQRENREWVMNHAKGSVLNLFAYTCAFSLCAARSPQTTSTLSIDAAKAALAKGRENFEQNGIPLEGHRFITEDAQKFLERCAKNNTKFDTIICDPPSFGRSGKIVFSLDDELEALVAACIRVAAPNATILFSINHRKIRLPRFRDAFNRALAQNKRSAASFEAFVNDNATGPLGVGTDLKTVRITLGN